MLAVCSNSSELNKVFEKQKRTRKTTAIGPVMRSLVWETAWTGAVLVFKDRLLYQCPSDFSQPLGQHRWGDYAEEANHKHGGCICLAARADEGEKLQQESWIPPCPLQTMSSASSVGPQAHSPMEPLLQPEERAYRWMEPSPPHPQFWDPCSTALLIYILCQQKKNPPNDWQK